MQNIFTVSEYYKILDLPADSTIEEIKKAYRKKARLYHPDVNHSPDAKDLFILATEAYEFLLDYQDKIAADDQAYNKVMDEWRRYRQSQSRRRANIYARASYARFKNSTLYRSTRIYDGTTIIFSFTIAILVLIYTIYGYIYRLRNPVPGLEKPSVLTFIMLLLLGLTFFSISVIHLIAFRDADRKRKKD